MSKFKEMLQAKLGKSNAPAPATTPAPVVIPIDPNIALREKAQQEENYISLASQIQKLTERSPQDLNKELSQLSSFPGYGGKLNYQISDEQIINDYNTSNLSRLNSIVERGNAQIVGIQQRLDPAQKLLDQLPSQDPRRAASQAYIDNLKSDLASVQSAVTSATQQVKNFKPAVATAPEAVKQVTALREYLQLPEQRASQQLREIDPDSYQASIALGQKYRELASAPIGQTQSPQTEAFRSDIEKAYKDYSTSGLGKTLDEPTEAYRAQLQKQIQDYSTSSIGKTLDAQTEAYRAQLQKQIQDYSTSGMEKTLDAETEAYRAQLQKRIQDYSMGEIGATTTQETEALRRQVEGEAAAQLALGSTLGAEEQRQYQQAARAAQTARGNIFGVAPAVEEAVTTGAAGEQRRLARYGAASQFLSSGQTTSDALARDVQLRAALQQGRYQTGGELLASGQTVSDVLARDAQLRNVLQQSKYQTGREMLESGQTVSDVLARDTQLRDALQQARYQAGGAMLASGQTVSDVLGRDLQLRNALQQSKLGAGGQFLSSGQTSGDALQRDITLRDALLQNRLGAASGFLASGPSVYNLSNARTGQQNAAFQNYIQANQALPGNFGQGASTAANFYQTTNPDAPLALQQAAVSLYNGLLGYQASTYGNMLQAQSQQPSTAAQFAQIAGGIGNIATPITSGFKSYTLGGVK